MKRPITGIHLVTENERTEAQKRELTRKYGYVAEIMQSKAGWMDIFHYVIQPENSPEIVYWGQELSAERAIECIDDFLEGVARKEA